MVVFVIVVSTIMAVGAFTYALLNINSSYDKDMGFEPEDREEEDGR